MLHVFIKLNLFALLVVTLSGCGQPPKQRFTLDYNKRIPNAIAKQDLQALKSILEEAQTSLYNYTTPEELDSVFFSVTAFKSDSVEYLDLIRRITRLQNTIACGHSGWGHPKSYKEYRKTKMVFFPLNIEIKNQNYYIKDQYSPFSYSLNGAEIKSINQIPVSQISQQLKQHMVRDGNSDPDGIEEVQQYFKMAYSNFIDNPDAFQLDIVYKGISKTISIDALPLSEIDSLHLQSHPTTVKRIPQLALNLKLYDNLNVGLFKINSFNNEYIEHFGQDFTIYTDSVFQILQSKKVETLIIDLRGNTGGWTANGKHLFSYFIDKPMEYIQKVEVKKYENYSFDSLVVSPPGYLDTFNLVLNTSGLYEWKNYPSLNVTPNNKNNYTGEVYILIDEMSRSCSAVFSALMQDYTNAYFLGQETGASKCGTSGMVMAIELPNTRIPVHFSTAKYYPNVKDHTNCRGVRPDIDLSQNQVSENPDINLVLNILKEADQ